MTGIKILTTARGTFDHSISAILELLRIYDERPKRSGAWRHVDGEAFLRASVILTVTAWETFIEDTIKGQFANRLSSSNSPQDVQSAFNHHAHRWIEDKPKPPSLAEWTGDGWKSVLKNECIKDVDKIQNPSSSVTREMFKRYFGQDVTKHWRWQGVGPARACKMLDALLEHRGQLAHRGREVHDRIAVVNRKDAGAYVELARRLMDRTEVALGVQPYFP